MLIAKQWRQFQVSNRRCCKTLARLSARKVLLWSIRQVVRRQGVESSTCALELSGDHLVDVRDRWVDHLRYRKCTDVAAQRTKWEWSPRVRRARVSLMGLCAGNDPTKARRSGGSVPSCQDSAKFYGRHGGCPEVWGDMTTWPVPLQPVRSCFEVII